MPQAAGKKIENKKALAGFFPLWLQLQYNDVEQI